MSDTILTSFLHQQYQAARRLAEQSDRLSLVPIEQYRLYSLLQAPGRLLLDELHKPNTELHRLATKSADPGPPDFYAVRFDCRSVLRNEQGEYAAAEAKCDLAIRFPNDYLRRKPDPGEIVCWLGPENIVHPNVRAPTGICIGRMAAGTELVDLLYQVYEIVTYMKWVPQDPLDEDAARWARHHQHLFPVDRRPLKKPPPSFSRTGGAWDSKVQG